MRNFWGSGSGSGVLLQMLVVVMVIVCLLLQDVRFVMMSLLRGVGFYVVSDPILSWIFQ